MKTVSKRFGALTLALTVMLMVLTTLMPAAAATTERIRLDGSFMQTTARSQLSLINSFRTSGSPWYWNSDDATKTYVSGLGSLVYDYDAEKLAMQRAAEIMVSFSHTRPDGRSFYTVDSDFGFSSSYTFSGENIAIFYGSQGASVQYAFDTWKEENDNFAGQGHRRNMLNRGFSAIGIACFKYGNYYCWVQELRTPARNTTATAANNSSATYYSNVSSSSFSSVTQDYTAQSYTLNVGESVNVPSYGLKISLVDAFNLFTNQFPLVCTPTYSVENTSVATIQNGKVVAKAAGTTNIVAKATCGGNTYTAKFPLTVKAVVQSISTATVTLSQTEYSYDGIVKIPSVTVTLGGKTLANGIDYYVTYSGNQNVGTGKVTVIGMGAYNGTASATFKIVSTPITNAVVSGKSYDSNGVPTAITVKVNGVTLTEGKDYTFTASTNDLGKGVVEVTAAGGYTGSIKAVLADPSSGSGSSVDFDLTTGDGRELSSATVKLTGTSGSYNATNSNGHITASVPDGVYTVEIACAGYVTKTFVASISEGRLTGETALTIAGDINCDGQRDYLDVSTLTMAIASEITISEYSYRIADLDGNSSANYIDLAMLINMING